LVKTILTKKELDSHFADLVKERAGYACEIPGCGKEDGLVSHHIIGRRNLNVRWDLDNGVCLCTAHHIWGKHSAHENPLFFIEIMLDLRGKIWYNRLKKKADKPYKRKSYNKIFRILQDESMGN